MVSLLTRGSVAVQVPLVDQPRRLDERGVFGGRWNGSGAVGGCVVHGHCESPENVGQNEHEGLCGHCERSGATNRGNTTPCAFYHGCVLYDCSVFYICLHLFTSVYTNKLVLFKIE